MSEPGPGTRPSAIDRAVHGLTAAVLGILVLAILLFQLSLARTRTFDPDEFQHAHSAFLISKGQLPYRDYFEHHPPLLHFLMAPVMTKLSPERDETSAFGTLFVLRVSLWCAGLLGAGAHFLLARRLLGTLGASVASLLLWSTLIMFGNTIEIRPDTAAFALLQVALLLLGRDASPRRTLSAFSLLGVGFLFTQKLAFPILGAVVATLMSRRSERALRTRAIAAMIFGLLWPTAACAGYFLARSGLPAFIEDVFLINLRWKARLSAWPFLVSHFFRPNPFLAVAGAFGLAAAAGRLVTPASEGSGRERFVLFTAAFGLIGLCALPVAFEQYYLLFLPQIAILASGFLIRLVEAVLGRPRSAGVAAITTLGLTLLGVSSSKDQIVRQQHRTSEAKQKAIAWILDNSATTDTVLDGFTGIGVFRPHAFRYFVLHAEMRMMLDAAVIRELEDGLESGAIAPRFVSFDSQLQSVSPRIRRLLDRDFALLGAGPAAVRLFPGGVKDWDDAARRFPGQLPAPRGPYVLCLEGWYEREAAASRTFRRSRGKSSTLLFPVHEPERVRSLLVTARAGESVPGLSATLRLNGEDLGEISLGAATQTTELSLNQGIVVRGLNRLEFSYPIRPAQIRPTLDARENSPLALESIALTLGAVGRGTRPLLSGE